MPLEELELSMPLRPGLRMMSLPLEQSEFEMSVPLQQSEMSMPLEESEMSMPLEEMEMSLPLEELELSMPADGAPAPEAVSLENESESGGNGVVLASFLAGVSALLVGFAAFFVGIVRRRRKAAEERAAEDMAEDVPVVGAQREDISVVTSVASPRDLNGDLDSPSMREVDLV